MSISYSSFNSVLTTWKKVTQNIRRNQEYYLQVTLALVSANLIVVSIKSEVACRKEMEKNELYKADLLMFASHMKSDDWVSSLSEKTNDPAERPKILKAEMAALIEKCVAGLPEYLTREERKVEVIPVTDDDDDDDDDDDNDDVVIQALAKNQDSVRIM